MAKYSFSNRDYEIAHGKAPRGTGHWAFELMGEWETLPISYVEEYRGKKFTTFFVPGTWTLTEAKRRASIMLEANAVPAGTTITVAP